MIDHAYNTALNSFSKKFKSKYCNENIRLNLNLLLIINLITGGEAYVVCTFARS